MASEARREPTISKEQYEQEFAERSGVSLEWLHAHGRHAYRCWCDYEECQGWQMLSREIHAVLVKLGQSE